MTLADDFPPMPGLPHRFWGTVKDTEDNNIADGFIVKAVVGDENYTTTVVNGTYGFYTPFYVEDPNNDNFGKTIYFFINDTDTTQTAVFDPGTTNLNLTVDLSDDDGNGENGDGGNGGGSNGGTSDNGETEKKSPIVDIGGPYFGVVNGTVTFNASGSYDPDGTITNYDWNFGDGSWGSGQVVTHIYDEYGSYIVSLMVTDNDGLIDTANTTVEIANDTDGDGWSDEEEIQYGTDPDNSSDFPLDTDDDHIPDIDDLDDDNDGLSDEIEDLLGSNSKDPTDVISVEIEQINYYLINIDESDLFDILYNSVSGNYTSVEITDGGLYMLDVDGDGIWDYLYDSSDGSISQYIVEEGGTSFDFNIYLIILIVIILFILIIVIVFRINRGREEE